MNVAWNGRDHSGRNVGAGVYFARIKTGSETASCRLVIVR
jgi:hypothetical protein